MAEPTPPAVLIGGEKFDLYLSEAQLDARIKDLGKQLEQDYAGKQPIFIGILNGAFIFLADLIREVQTIEVEVDFFKLSSYGDRKISSGAVSLLKAVDASLEGRDVVVVEDIIDSGLSISYIRKFILGLNPKSLRFCALLYKEDVAQIDFEIEYVGFKIPKHFVIGYGLDYKQLKRNLKQIYKLSE